MAQGVITVKLKRLQISFLYLFLLLPFFKPYYISVLHPGSFIDTVFDVSRIISIGICAVLDLIACYKKNNTIVWITLFNIVLLFAAIPEYRFARISTLINMVGVFFCVHVLIEKNAKKLVDTMFGISITLLFLNLIVYFIYPLGLNQMIIENERVHFLGKSNVLAYSEVLALALCFIRDEKCEESVSVFTLILCAVTSIVCPSSTGLIAIISTIFAYVLNIKKVKWLNFRRAIIIALGINIMFVFIGAQGLFKVFIEIVLQKQTSFTGRTTIWKEMIEIIQQNPIWGLGQPTAKLKVWYGRDTYCHNALLDIALKGGIVAITTFLLILLNVEHKVREGKTYISKKIFPAAVLGFLVIGMMEGLEDRIAFWIFIALAAHCHIIERELLE